MMCSKDGLLLLQRSPSLWIEQEYNPHNWLTVEGLHQKKVQTVPSTGKVKVIVFWDSQGLIPIEYLKYLTEYLGKYQQ